MSAHGIVFTVRLAIDSKVDRYPLSWEATCDRCGEEMTTPKFEIRGLDRYRAGDDPVELHTLLYQHQQKHDIADAMASLTP